MNKLNLWRIICRVFVFCALEVFARPASSFTTLVSFNGTAGGYPVAGLVYALAKSVASTFLRSLRITIVVAAVIS